MFNKIGKFQTIVNTTIVRFFYTLVLLFIAITNYAQISHGTLEDVVVCGETVEWEVITSGAGTLIIDELPPGYFFDGMIGSTCGATLTSSSPPTFTVTSACTITYAVHAECQAFIVRDEAQGGDPNMNFSVSYIWNGTSLPSISLTAETNAPELKLEMVTNGSPASPFTSFNRRVRVCNDGLDSYMNLPLEVCFDNGADLLLNTVFLDDGIGGIALPIDANNCITISPAQFQFALDRNGGSTGTDPSKFEGSSSTNTSATAECLFLDLDLTLNSCAANGDFTQLINTNWGCNAEECALPAELSANANISFDVPNLTMTGDLEPGDGCNMEHLFTEVLTITNSGNGGADNVVIHIKPSWNFNALMAFDIGNIIFDDGINPPSIITGTVTNSPTYSYHGSLGDCPQKFTDLGGVTPAIAFDVALSDIIEPGQTITLRVPLFLCCVNDCVQSAAWDRFEGDINATNTCNTANFYTPLRLLQNWFHGRLRSSPVFEPDMNDGDTQTINLDVTDISLDNYFPNYGWENRPFYKIDFPCGMIYGGNARVVTNSGAISIPETVNWDPVTGELYMEWDYPLNSGAAINWRGGKVEFDVTGDCSVCGGGAKSFALEEGFILGTDCTEYCTVEQCYNFQIQLHCGNCPWPGITPDSYEIVRVNYGFEDLNNDGLPDNGAVADPSDIRLDRAIVGDTIEGTWHANVTTDATHPSWEFAYAQTTMSGMANNGKAEVIGARIEVIDANGGTILCASVPFSQSSLSVVDFDFSPASLCAAGCPDFCGFVYEDGDEIYLTGIYAIVDNDICRAAKNIPVTVTTDMYAAEQAAPPQNTVAACASCDPIIYPDYRWTCDNYSGAYKLITPFVTQATAQTFNIRGCGTATTQNGFYWGIGPGSSYHFNLFPFEYRPFAIWDTIYVSIPAGYTVENWDLYYSRGNGTSAVGSYVYDISPDYIDANPVLGLAGSTVYCFNTKQYFDNGDFIISDDGGVMTIYPTVRPSCGVESQILDKVEYWGTPLWMNGNYECDIFGPAAADNLVFFKPELEIQSDVPTAIGDCPRATWPVRILGVNNDDAENVFLYFPPSTIKVDTVYDNTGTAILENSNSFFELGDIDGPSSNDFSVAARYITCDVDSVLAIIGWDCAGYPNSILDANPECLDSIWLKVEPALPAFNLAILQPAGDVDVNLCEEVDYEFQYKNVGDAKAYNLRSYVYLPISNVEISPGSLEIEYPCGSGYEVWTTNYPAIYPQPLGTLLRFDVTYESRINSNIDPLGINSDGGWAYPNISEVDNCFNIRFKVNTACGFEAAGGYIRTQLLGRGPCGLPRNDKSALVYGAIENAGSFNIIGVEPYEMGMSATMDPILFTCAGNQALDINLEMLDTGTTEITDSIKVNIPYGFSYVSDNSGLPVNTIAYDSMTTLIYPIDPPLTTGETMNFSIQLALDDTLLECGETNLSVRATTLDQVECIDNPGVLCDVGVYTAQENIFVQIDKPTMQIEMLSAFAACSDTTLPTDVEIEIENTSATSINDFEVEVYANLDGSCSLLGDNVLLGTIPINTEILAGQSAIVTQTFDVPANACQLISTLKGCVCENASTSCIDVEMEVNELDVYETCHNDPIQIQTCSNPDIAYNWSPIGSAQLSWLDDASISNPTLTIPNTSLGNQTFEYEVSLDRGTICRVLDTVSIVVFPLEENTDPIALTYCTNQIGALSAPAGLIGTWSPSTNVFDVNDPNSILSAIPAAVSRVYTFTYTDVNNCEAYFYQTVEIVECVDIALEKDLYNPPTPINMGEIIQFELTVTNESTVDATNVIVQDSLPACLEYAGDGLVSVGSLINDLNRNLTWNVGNLAAGQSISTLIDVKVIRIGSCLNTAQVESHDQKDSDSNPNNDDGDQSEDDEDGVSFEACKAGVCLPVNIIKQ